MGHPGDIIGSSQAGVNESGAGTGRLTFVRAVVDEIVFQNCFTVQAACCIAAPREACPAVPRLRRSRLPESDGGGRRSPWLRPAEF